MNFDKIIYNIKHKNIHPIYLLMGDEIYYINKILNFIKNNILKNDEERNLDQIILYSKNVKNIDNIFIYLNRYPIISNYNVVIIKDAQYLNKIDNLIKYLYKPIKTTILVLCYNKFLDKRKKIYKMIKNIGIIFESKKYYQYQIPEWIEKLVTKLEYSITDTAKFILADYLGTNLSYIEKEIEKLIINLPKKSKISEDIIKNNIGINRLYNIYDLQKEILKKNIINIYKIIFYIMKNINRLYMFSILNILIHTFIKILEYHLYKKKILKKIDIPFFLIKNYELGINLYSIQDLLKIITYLKDFDIQCKNINNKIIKDKNILIDFFLKIFN